MCSNSAWSVDSPMQKVRLWDIISRHSFDLVLADCAEVFVSEQLIS